MYIVCKCNFKRVYEEGEELPPCPICDDIARKAKIRKNPEWIKNIAYQKKKYQEYKKNENVL